MRSPVVGNVRSLAVSGRPNLPACRLVRETVPGGCFCPRVIDRGKCHADRGRAGRWVKNKQDRRTLALPGMHNTHSGCGRQEGSAANREAHGLSERCIRNCRPRGRRCFCRLPSPLFLSLSLSSVFFPPSDSLPVLLSLSLSIPPSLPISVLDLPILPLRSSRACLSRSFYLAGVAPRVFPSIRSVSRIFPSRFPSSTCGRLIALFTPCSLRSPGCVRPRRKFRRATTSAESRFVRANCAGPPRRASRRIRRSNTAHRSCKTRDRRHLAQMHTPTEGGASPGALSFSLSRLRLSC